jgi:hypothetical protein
MFTRWDYWEYRRWRRRRRRRIATALAIAFLLLVAAAAAHATGAHAGHGTTAPAAKPHTLATRARPVHWHRHLGAGPHQASLFTAGLSWTDFHGIELPVSAHDGPRHMRNGLAWGFNDTRSGALLAAVNIVVRTAAFWGPAIYQPTIRHQVTGPDAAALLAGDASGYAAMAAAAHVRPGRPIGHGYAVEAGFRFIAYTPSGAAIDVVTEGPEPGGSTVIVTTRIETVWRHGDWRVVAPPGGNWAHAATVISSLTGYMVFANQG